MILYSIGHSTRTMEELVGLLRGAGVAILADVRSFPMSRRHPHFNREALGPALAECGIDYHWIQRLGGRKHEERGCCSPNGLWRHSAFRAYADYAMTQEFHEGLRTLRTIAGSAPCAFMCSEAVWWRCHRRIITDYLLAGGDTVLHIMGTGQLSDATMTDGAEPQAGSVLYPPAQMAMMV